MKPIRVVLDTNVLHSALYSATGASNAIITLVRDGKVAPCISVTLVLEYEDVLTRHRRALGLNIEEIRAFLGFIVNQSERVKVYFLWRPCLKDPKDDMVMETAVAGGARFIVTHNIADFAGADRFGIQVVTPGWFVKNFGGIK